MKYLTLNDGNKIPNIGLGVYKASDLKECEEAVLYALQIGYRMIDTAQAYYNEEAVGNAIKKSGIPREEIFISTKIHFQNADDALNTVKESLKKLQTDYIDMLMLHWPYGNYYHAYRVMEELKASGVVKSIGVCNFDPARLIDLIHFNKVVPAMNQIELHVYNQRNDERKYNNEYGIITEAYAPLGQGKTPEAFKEPAILELANKYNKTPAQIMLRFISQQGIIVIPKSVHKERIKENFEIFDFELSNDEMEKLKALNKDFVIGGKAENAKRARHLIEGID